MALRPIDPTEYRETTLRELERADTESIRDYCCWNDPNGDFDEYDSGKTIDRSDLLAIVREWDADQTCGFCHVHIGLGAHSGEWKTHGKGRCTK